MSQEVLNHVFFQFLSLHLGLLLSVLLIRIIGILSFIPIIKRILDTFEKVQNEILTILVSFSFGGFFFWGVFLLGGLSGGAFILINSIQSFSHVPHTVISNEETFSSDSETNASESLENLEEKCPLDNLQRNISSSTAKLICCKKNY